MRFDFQRNGFGIPPLKKERRERHVELSAISSCERPFVSGMTNNPKKINS